MTDFDNDYVQWKAWESQAFCVSTAEQSRYFAAELRKTGQPLPAGAKVLEVGFPDFDTFRPFFAPLFKSARYESMS